MTISIEEYLKRLIAQVVEEVKKERNDNHLAQKATNEGEVK